MLWLNSNFTEEIFNRQKQKKVGKFDFFKCYSHVECLTILWNPTLRESRRFLKKLSLGRRMGLHHRNCKVFTHKKDPNNLFPIERPPAR